ncbi:MAG: P-II family nitrogen regulator [Candidatus Omnitrophota bacterium]|nr:P-II family nitrogen regulator [Candidatus Omnitrophota bacterium]
MKKIEAIIRPEKLAPVISALEAIGCSGISITEIEGHGKQKGMVQQWRGEKYTIKTLPKVKLELIVSDKEVRKISTAIMTNAKTGEMGDGKVFLYPVENAMRIRTGEEGESAI